MDPAGSPVTGGGQGESSRPAPAAVIKSDCDRTKAVFPLLTNSANANSTGSLGPLAFFSCFVSLLTCYTEDMQGKTLILIHTWTFFSDRFFFRVF